MAPSSRRGRPLGPGEAEAGEEFIGCGGVGEANRKVERLESELAKHKLALEIAGKAHALLEMLAEGAQDEPKPKP